MSIMECQGLGEGGTGACIKIVNASKKLLTLTPARTMFLAVHIMNVSEREPFKII